MHANVGLCAMLVTVALAAGCAGPQQNALSPANAPLSSRTTAGANASAKAVAAFFNDQPVSIFIIQLSPEAAQQVLAHNKNVNTIFEAPGFLPVINEIQGPGFNPLWQVVNITFNAGTTPHQFTSQAAILAAQASGQITLTSTDVVDTVPVVGSGGK